MTYKELKTVIDNLTEEQQTQDVTIYCVMTNEYYPLSYFTIDDNDVIKNQPVISINN